MTERPILFSATMVHALLSGTKTQTRRALRTQPPVETRSFCTYHHPDPRVHHWAFDGGSLLDFAVPCPYGQVGDRLYVREAWRTICGLTDSRPPRDIPKDYPLRYEADGAFVGGSFHPGKARRAFHMPRWASRIDLEVTGVRVERLQDISAIDALQEGLEECHDLPYRWDHPVCFETAQRLYSELWEQINGPGSWDANPWVWVIEFRRIKP